MADLKWLEEGKHVQRAEFTEWPRSPQLELAITASADREWVMAKTTRDLRWRFDVPRRRQSQERPRWTSSYDARPSMAPQKGADGSSSRGNAWEHPLPQTVRPNIASQEELRKLVRTEVASLLTSYERRLEEAKTTIAGRDAEIASLKQELAAVKAQAKSSAVPAAEPMSPPDPTDQPGTHDWRKMVREFRELNREAKAAMHQCKFFGQAQDQLGVGFTLQQREIRALQQQLKEMQHWRLQQLKAGGVHSLSEPLKEKEQNQEPEEKRQVRLTSTGTWVLQPAPTWPTAAKGFQYEATKVPVTVSPPLYPPRPSAL